MSGRYFLRISDVDDKYEWGFRRDWIPCVGDTLALQVGKPGEEPNDDFVDTVIVERTFYLYGDEHDEICLAVKLLSLPEDGDIADSEEWPCNEYDLRQRELKEKLDKIGSWRNIDP